MHACLPDLGMIRFAQTETHELFKWFWNFVGEKILQEIYLQNCEVENDFSGGLSSRVFLNFFLPKISILEGVFDFR